jgi:hypothetical protein
MKPILWIHGDCLSPYNPALKAYPNTPAVFVWDEALLDQWQISFKRIVFLYECLLELPVTIRRGEIAVEIARFAIEHQADCIVTTESPGPRFKAICKGLRQVTRLEVLPVEPFLSYKGQLDLKRFSRYWSVAERYAFGGEHDRD